MSRELNDAQEVSSVIGSLLASRNACDRRKGRDLEELIALGKGPWKDRFRVIGARSGPRRTLVALCGLLGTRGLVWAGSPRVHHTWTLAVAIASDYPLTLPAVQFLKPVPFNPHCLHAAFVPDSAGLPAELQAYLRKGNDGACCYVKVSQWSPTRDSLATAVWLVSRLLSGQIHAEEGSLNPEARDFMLRDGAGIVLAELGPPLPVPEGSAGPEGLWAGEETEDVRWLEEEGADGGA